MPAKNFIFILFIFISIASSNFLFVRPVYARSCSGNLNVLVSQDKVNFFSSIILRDGDIKYYLQVRDSQGLCSTSFDVYVNSFNGNSVSNPIRSPWGNFRSNDEGIARIDVPDLVNSSTTASYRPYGSSAPWSNQITVIKDSTQKSSNIQNIVLSDYLMNKPGHVYIYKSKNNLTGIEGTTRLQLEEETLFCGTRKVIPWRFTKDNANAYWTPTLPNTFPGTENFRWFVTSENDVVKSTDYAVDLTNYNKYIYAIGGKRYKLNNDSAVSIRDVFYSEYVRGTMYTSVNTSPPLIPSYVLGEKNMTVPYILVLNGSSLLKRIYDFNTDPNKEECASLIQPGAASNHDWTIRIEKDSLPGYSDVLRIDFYEGKVGAKNLLRENWYLAKNIGLVKLTQDFLNEYGNLSTSVSPYCINTNNCLSDSSTNPHIEVNLTEYFLNPIVSVKASVDNVNYSDEVYTTKSRGYYIKVSAGEKLYTGYLESNTSSGIKKWPHWVNNGYVFLNKDILSGFQYKSYLSNFRIWVPDDAYGNESRISDTNISWSNNVNVHLLKDGDLDGTGGNNGVTTQDALLFRNYIFNKDMSGVVNNTLLDVNIDGNINTGDLVHLLDSI